MKHRNSKHSKRVALCRKNENQTCEYGKHCWYIDTNETDKSSYDSNSDNNSLQIIKLLESRITSMENQFRMKIN